MACGGARYLPSVIFSIAVLFWFVLWRSRIMSCPSVGWSRLPYITRPMAMLRCIVAPCWKYPLLQTRLPSVPQNKNKIAAFCPGLDAKMSPPPPIKKMNNLFAYLLSIVLGIATVDGKDDVPCCSYRVKTSEKYVFYKHLDEVPFRAIYMGLVRYTTAHGLPHIHWATGMYLWCTN